MDDNLPTSKREVWRLLEDVRFASGVAKIEALTKCVKFLATENTRLELLVQDLERKVKKRAASEPKEGGTE